MRPGRKRPGYYAGGPKNEALSPSFNEAGAQAPRILRIVYEAIPTRAGLQ